MLKRLCCPWISCLSFDYTCQRPSNGQAGVRGSVMLVGMNWVSLGRAQSMESDDEVLGKCRISGKHWFTRQGYPLSREGVSLSLNTFWTGSSRPTISGPTTTPCNTWHIPDSCCSSLVPSFFFLCYFGLKLKYPSLVCSLYHFDSVESEAFSDHRTDM